MAWPTDARDFDFAPGVYVPSDTLNNIQDEIINLCEYRYLQGTFPVADPTTIWDVYASAGLATATGSHAADVFIVEFPLRSGDYISEIEIKHYYNTWTKSNLFGYQVLKADNKYASSTTAPSYSVVCSGTSALAATGYYSFTDSFTEVEIGVDEKVYFVGSGGDSGDVFVGCKLKVRRKA